MLKNTQINRAATKKIALALGPLNEHVVFVGGEFNKLNGVEHYIIHQLSGLNLNTGIFSEQPPSPYGIPVVVGEAKTPIRPNVSWLDGAHEIHQGLKFIIFTRI